MTSSFGQVSIWPSHKCTPIILDTWSIYQPSKLANYNTHSVTFNPNNINISCLQILSTDMYVILYLAIKIALTGYNSKKQEIPISCCKPLMAGVYPSFSLNAIPGLNKCPLSSQCLINIKIYLSIVFLILHWALLTEIGMIWSEEQKRKKKKSKSKLSRKHCYLSVNGRTSHVSESIGIYHRFWEGR